MRKVQNVLIIGIFLLLMGIAWLLPVAASEENRERDQVMWIRKEDLSYNKISFEERFQSFPQSLNRGLLDISDMEPRLRFSGEQIISHFWEEIADLIPPAGFDLRDLYDMVDISASERVAVSAEGSPYYLWEVQINAYGIRIGEHDLYGMDFWEDLSGDIFIDDETGCILGYWLSGQPDVGCNQERLKILMNLFDLGKHYGYEKAEVLYLNEWQDADNELNYDAAVRFWPSSREDFDVRVLLNKDIRGFSFNVAELDSESWEMDGEWEMASEP